MSTERELLKLFAELLDYPKPGLGDRARQAMTLVAVTGPEAIPLIASYARFVDETSPGHLEEIYTGLFELNAQRYPYVGYHLFGETYKRSVFLLGLKERYNAHGFEVEPEVPDHLPSMLRFCSRCDDPDLVDELISDAIVPALEKMIARDSKEGSDEESIQEPGSIADNPYTQLMQALALVCNSQKEATVCTTSSYS